MVLLEPLMSVIWRSVPVLRMPPDFDRASVMVSKDERVISPGFVTLPAIVTEICFVLLRERNISVL